MWEVKSGQVFVGDHLIVVVLTLKQWVSFGRCRAYVDKRDCCYADQILSSWLSCYVFNRVFIAFKLRIYALGSDKRPNGVVLFMSIY